MGLRSGDAEGDRAGLAEDDPGDCVKLAANLIDQRLAGGGVRFAALAAFEQQGVDSGGCRADHPLRASVEQLLLRLAGLVPRGNDRVIVPRVGRRSAREGPDHPKRVANARKA